MSFFPHLWDRVCQDGMKEPGLESLFLCPGSSRQRCGITSASALFFMNVSFTICTSWAAPSGSEVKQCFSTIQALKEEEEKKENKRKEIENEKKRRKKTPPSLLHNTSNPSVMAICRITRPKTNTSSLPPPSTSSYKACYNRDPYQSLGFAPAPLCTGMQGCTFAIPLCCWKQKSWKHVSWHVMVFQCIVTILLTDSCLAGCPKLTFQCSVESCILFVRACVRVVVIIIKNIYKKYREL